MYGVALSVLILAAAVFLVIVFLTFVAGGLTSALQGRRRRQTPLNKIFREERKIHSVGPDALVDECVRLMTKAGIGSLVVLDGDKVAGIFTERDALNRVLAGSLEPAHTKVSEVMTRDPFCIPATTTVESALKLISERRFRHLPITEGGRFVTVVSSGDLTHWLVADEADGPPTSSDLAAAA